MADLTPLSDLNEKELVALAKTEPDAFGELYERYVTRIYNYVYYRTGNKQDAEDLTSRVFHRALQHIPRYKERGVPFSAWLYRIAHNLVVNFHRDKSRRTIIPIEDTIIQSPKHDAPEIMTERQEEVDQLLEALHTLPDDRQLLIILKFLDRMPNAQIGQIMGRSEGAVKSLYHRTLLALRDEFPNLKSYQQLDDLEEDEG